MIPAPSTTYTTRKLK